MSKGFRGRLKGMFTLNCNSFACVNPAYLDGYTVICSRGGFSSPIGGDLLGDVNAVLMSSREYELVMV